MSLWKRVIFSLLMGMVGGACVALGSPGDFWMGLAGAGLLIFLCVFGLTFAWQWAGGGRLLAWMMVLAFVLRVGMGILAGVGLPLWGFDTPQQKSGYLFTDAYKRDLQGWELATHGESLMVGFEKGFYADQYGGLLSLSAAIYRYFSPDAHRPVMVVIFGAFMAALGVPFLLRALTRRWDKRLAALATWIMVLYPDSILFGASQMREPMLIGLMCIAFWGVLTWRENRLWGTLAIVFSLGLTFLLSSMVVATLTIMLGILFWFEYIAPISIFWKRLGQIGLVLGGLLTIVLFGQWLTSAATWDILLAQRQSGWVAKIIEEAGVRFKLPIITVYGLVQPVLPAAVADIDTRPFWYVTAVLRALGWYLLAPLLLYSVFALWTHRDIKNKSMLVWISLFVIIWCLIAAVRAGGDQWDNPRYRVIFIPWLALLAAWGLDWALKKRDAWLVRWILIEFIFLGFFTNWYFSRYLHWWGRLSFWQNIAWIVGLSLVVLGSGWIGSGVKRLITQKK
ncbi:MAG: hypothetical protein LWX83_15665 [Anaerolineae bacterium]|nr:hypothetical protein [Anaerolineae bacterium]